MEPIETRSDSRDKRIAATPAAVYAAMSDPARVARWWGPDGFTNTIHKFEFLSANEQNLARLSKEVLRVAEVK